MRFVSLFFVALCAGAAESAVIHIKPTMVKVYDQDFRDVTDLAVMRYTNEWVRLAMSDATTELFIMKVNYSFAISDLQEGQLGFGNARFDIGLGKQLSPSSDFQGWLPEVDAMIDHNGPAPGDLKNKWAVNGDFGVAGDLREIVVGTDPSDFGPINIDPRRTFGQQRDEYFGTVFVELPAMQGSTGRLLVKRSDGRVYDANNQLVAENVTVKGEPLGFLVGMPEPSSAILLSLGGGFIALSGRYFAGNRR